MSGESWRHPDDPSYYRRAVCVVQIVIAGSDGGGQFFTTRCFPEHEPGDYSVMLGTMVDRTIDGADYRIADVTGVASICKRCGMVIIQDEDLGI